MNTDNVYYKMSSVMDAMKVRFQTHFERQKADIDRLSSDNARLKLSMAHLTRTNNELSRVNQKLLDESHKIHIERMNADIIKRVSELEAINRNLAEKLSTTETELFNTICAAMTKHEVKITTTQSKYPMFNFGSGEITQARFLKIAHEVNHKSSVVNYDKSAKEALINAYLAEIRREHPEVHQYRQKIVGLTVKAQ